MALEQEIEYFNKELPSWLGKHRGMFVLVKGDRFWGAFGTPEEALAAGAEHFGAESFLVRQVVENQVEPTVPALTLGILNAYTPHPA